MLSELDLHLDVARRLEQADLDYMLTGSMALNHYAQPRIRRRKPARHRSRHGSRLYRRLMGLAIGRKPGKAEIQQQSQTAATMTKNAAELLESEDNETVLKDLGAAKVLYCRIRYFTDGAVIGSKEFVNEAFANARDRFGPKRASWVQEKTHPVVQSAEPFRPAWRSKRGPAKLLAHRPARAYCHGHGS